MYPTSCRIASGSFATSRPSTSALPVANGISPQSARMSVVFPDPFGPSSPNTSPRSTANDTSLTAVKSPNLMLAFSMESAAAISLGLRRVEEHLGRHAGLEHAVRIGHLHLHGEHLVPPFIHRLHVPRGELANRGDVRHPPGELAAG